MAHPLKKSEQKREEPKLGEPKLVEPDSLAEIEIAQELQGESVSDTLVRARQQVGQDLRSIAEVLCIRYSYLDAIERGQYENLPGPTYAVGFVRTYAEYLGLDGEQVVDRFKSEVQGLDSQTKLHFPTPAPEGKMPGGAVFLVAALLFAGAYGVWFYLSNNGESLGDLVAPVPDRLQELVDGDTPATTAEVGTAELGGSAVPQSAAPQSAAPQSAAPQSAAPQAAATAPAASAASDGNDATNQAAEETPAAPAAEAQAPQTAESAPAGPAAEAPAAPESAPQATTRPAEEPAGDTAPATAAAEAPSAPASAPDVPEESRQAASVAAAPAGNTAETTPETTPAATRDDPYAIPAAPENEDTATAFLNNHEPKVYGEENADARIVLKASQDAWVQVHDRQGNLLLTRVLRVGDSYRVPNEADLTLLTGNAGGLEIVVDGRALAPLGPVGAVRRNIPLEPAALLNGAGRQP